MNTTGWLKGLQVTGDGTGTVSHAGVALLRALANKTGLTAGLSRRWLAGGWQSMTGAGCWRTWRVRSLTALR